MTDRITLLTHPKLPLAKIWLASGEMKPYADGKHFKHRSVKVADIRELSTLLSELEHDSHTCVIRGEYVGDGRAAEIDPEYRPGSVRRTKDLFLDSPRHFALIEVDTYEPLTADPVADPALAIHEYLFMCLPSCFQGASYHWQLSNSAGHPKHAGKLKVHIWFWLSQPYNSEQLKAWASASGIAADTSVFQTNQVHYTAAPLFDVGVSDPISIRSGFVEGLIGDSVDLLIDDATLAVAETSGRRVGRKERLDQITRNDPRAQLLAARGMVKSTGKDGELRIECPRSAHHTTESGESSTVYYLPHTGGHAAGHFKCLHASCSGVKQSEFDAALEFKEDLFENLDQSSPGAQHLTTDQANADRIVRHFAGRLMVANDRWYAWTGTHWDQDEGEVYRCTFNLSKIVHAEADAWTSQKFESADEKAKNEKMADVLRGWAKKSEMRGTIEAARHLARQMLTINGNKLDRDQWALNCLNGTVDLRTGQLRSHDPKDYITRVLDIEYDPNAKAPTFEKVLSAVTREDTRPTKPVASFLKRWLGYCATGSTREQKFVVHYGDGRNGKSTINDIITSVLGPYAGTAAPGLLMSSTKDKHPTEIADLFGRRMVTAHESGDGNTLREDLVKQATGSDRLKARFMRGDFFEFEPTHKLQLLTNHKPVIKGQDEGIWRRVLLLPYDARFGSAEELAAGRATHLRDMRIAERLESEKQGILTWIIQGAVEWYTDGLNPPSVVLAASKDYQTESDRLLQFVKEQCELSKEYEAPLSDGWGGGVYPEYTTWCSRSGYHPLSKHRFSRELGRVVPLFRKEEKKITVSGGRRVDVMMLCGLRLAVEG